YHDSYKFANKSGISLLDFPLNTAIRNVFGSNTNFSDIDSVITAEGSNFTWKEDLVTFIDNHDMARFLTVNNNNNRLHEALACIQHHGTEHVAARRHVLRLSDELARRFIHYGHERHGWQ